MRESEQFGISHPKTPGYLEFERLATAAFADIRNGAKPGPALDAAAARIDHQLKKYER